MLLNDWSGSFTGAWARLGRHGESSSMLDDVATVPRIPSELLRAAVQAHEARAQRHQFFEPNMFGEGAWNLLLALYIAKGRKYRMKTTDACYEARVPTTTALRWLEYLASRGHVSREVDKDDARCVYVDITASAVALMNSYLESMLRDSLRNDRD